jgi:hypothetical protein
MTITPNTYYGNDSETYFVNDVLTIFCIQSPDLVDIGDYRQVESMPDDVRELDGDAMAAYDWPDYAEELAGIKPREVANV